MCLLGQSMKYEPWVCLEHLDIATINWPPSYDDFSRACRWAEMNLCSQSSPSSKQEEQGMGEKAARWPHKLWQETSPRSEEIHKKYRETGLTVSKLPEPETPSKTWKRLQIPFHKPPPRHSQRRQQPASRRKPIAAAGLKWEQKPRVLGKMPIWFTEGTSWYGSTAALDADK